MGEGDLIALEDIANQLIDDNLYLTALELHSELLHRGKTLPVLCDFFGNSGNLEHVISGGLVLDPLCGSLPRTSSVQTLESLDLTRYSEDGELLLSEKVAVLEFELRKAKDAIRSLRANLTVVTEQAPAHLENANAGGAAKRFERNNEDSSSCPSMLPHELRALNFLINEYLLSNNFKLTSITLAEENDNQDFEDWDEVGLNINKPPELLQLYRNYNRWQGPAKVVTREISAQTDAEENCVNLLNVQTQTDDPQAEILSASKNSLPDVVSHNQVDNLTEPNAAINPRTTPPEQDVGIEDVVEVLFPKDLAESDRCRRNSVQQSSDTGDKPLNDLGEKDLDMGHDLKSDKSIPHHKENEVEVLNLETEFLFSELRCFKEGSVLCSADYIDNDDVERIENELASLSAETDVVSLISRNIAHIVPNVILNKRHELLPILVACIYLDEDASRRETSTGLLFNLVKKPDEAQREAISVGIETLGRLVNVNRIESELLPQCWENIHHKYPQRRKLVAQMCSVLSKYSRAEICHSLIFSMLYDLIANERDLSVLEVAMHSFAELIFSLAKSSDSEKMDRIIDVCLNYETSDSAFEHLSRSIGVWSISCEREPISYTLSVLKITISSGNFTKANRCIRFLEQVLPYVFLLFSKRFSTHNDEVQPMTYCGKLRLNEVLGVTYSSWLSDLSDPSSLERTHIQENLIHPLTSIVSLFTRDLNELFPQMLKLYRELFSCLTTLCCDLVFFDAVNSFSDTCQMFLKISQDGDIEEELTKKLLDSDTDVEDIRHMIAAILSCHPAMMDSLFNSIWAVVVHTDVTLRVRSSILLADIVDKCDLVDAQLKNKVLPALITLSTDPDQRVKIASIRALTLILALAANDKGVRDKVEMQLESLWKEMDSEILPRVELEFLYSFEEVLIRTDNYHIRYEFFVPRLCAIASSPKITNSPQLIQQCIRAFEQLVNCPKKVSQHYILPSLKQLSINMPTGDGTVSALIKVFEQQDGETSSQISNAAQSIGEMKKMVSKMFTNK